MPAPGSKSCDGQRDHVLWGATSDGNERKLTALDGNEYPLLRSRIASALHSAAISHKTRKRSPSHPRAAHASVAAAGKQPLGSRHPELVPWLPLSCPV